MSYIIPPDFPNHLRIELCSYLDETTLKHVKQLDINCQKLSTEEIWKRKLQISLSMFDIKEVNRVFDMFKGRAEKRYDNVMKYFDYPGYRLYDHRYEGILQSIEDIEENNTYHLIGYFDPCLLYLYYLKNGEEKLDNLMDKIEFKLNTYEDSYISMFMDEEINQRLKANRNKKFKQFIHNIEKYIDDWLPCHIDGLHRDLKRNLVLYLYDHNKYPSPETRVEGLACIFLRQPLPQDIWNDNGCDCLILHKICKDNNVDSPQQLLDHYFDIFKVCKSYWLISDWLCNQKYTYKQLEEIIDTVYVTLPMKEKLLTYQKSRFSNKKYERLYQKFINC